MNTEEMIDVTGVDLKLMVKTVYDLSRPQGLGHLHFDPKPLTDEEVNSLIKLEDKRVVMSLDYVKGRACKFNVFKEGDKLYIRNRWFDHSDNDLRELLTVCGVNQ